MATGAGTGAEPAARPRQAGRRVCVLLGLAALLVLAALLSLRVGSLTVSWHDALAALFDYRGPAAAPTGQTVVHSLRLPRTVVGVAVGIALGMTGALMQGLTRNPLADPGLLGINSGAGFAISAAITAGAGSVGTYLWFSFLGAAVAGVLVYVLGSVGGGATPVKLALAGAIIAAFVGALTSTLNVVNPNAADVARFWLAGSVAGVAFPTLLTVTPFLLLGLLVALGCGRALNGLALGDDVARALGQRVVLSRVAVALAVVLLAASAVALAGPIAFIGLMVPHVSRFLVGPDYRWILPAAALLGPSVLLLADVAGRIVAMPGEIQVGIMTAVLGAPVFIYLARRRALDGL
ncbi:FecCD family ABC transporter permease [Pseudonocardia sp. GCM10023141]